MAPLAKRARSAAQVSSESHAAALPAENRFEFGNRGALVRSAGRTDFADAMRALLDASGAEGEVFTRSGSEDNVDEA
jgi:hypothetical protein